MILKKYYNFNELDELLSILPELKDQDLKMRPQLLLKYSKDQKYKYMSDDPSCIYEQWDKPWGIHKTGKNFPVMVAKDDLLKIDFEVSLSGSNNFGYALIRYKKKRWNMPGFKKLYKIFGENLINTINEAEIKNLSGGDPDLIAFDESRKIWFFGEVKEEDWLTKNQIKLIPIIEKFLCPVVIIKVSCAN